MRTALVLAALLLSAAQASAQSDPPACPGARADEEGVSVGTMLSVHPTRLATAIDSVLDTRGYVILRAPQAEGTWVIEPRVTWTGDMEGDGLAKNPHPGVEVRVAVQPEGDSIRFTVFTRAICVVEPVDAELTAENLETVAELIHATDVTSGVTGMLEGWEAAGVDMGAPVERPGFTLKAPERIGDYTLANVHTFDDARLGTGLRYEGERAQRVDVYVYPGPPADSACPAECAAAQVDAEVDGFIESFPELIRRGYYSSLDVVRDSTRTPAPGDAWRAGRHLVVKGVTREGAVESHFVLFAFPSYMVKVRMSVPPSADSGARVDAFVRDALAAMTQR